MSPGADEVARVFHRLKCLPTLPGIMCAILEWCCILARTLMGSLPVRSYARDTQLANVFFPLKARNGCRTVNWLSTSFLVPDSGHVAGLIETVGGKFFEDVDERHFHEPLGPLDQERGRVAGLGACQEVRNLVHQHDGVLT